MINGFSIEGHAIVSRNGMIASSDGTMPPCLIREKDWQIFQHHLDEAEIVVLGRLAHEKHENKGRKRLILTSKVKSLQTQGLNNFWNPDGLSFENLLDQLKLNEGIIAITGGKRVFDCFLKIGYDGFLLSEVSEIIENGISCFTDGHPRDVLREHGMKILAQTKLEPDLLSTLWSR